MEQTPLLATASFAELRKKLIARSAWLIVVIFFLNFMAMTFYWYSAIWWFDMPMHFFGGAWLGLTVLWMYFFARSTPRARVNPAKALVIGLVFVLAIGIAWEIFEVGIDRLITMAPFDRLDTLSDIFFDLAGGAAAMLYLMRRGYVESDYN